MLIGKSIFFNIRKEYDFNAFEFNNFASRIKSNRLMSYCIPMKLCIFPKFNCSLTLQFPA